MERVLSSDDMQITGENIADIVRQAVRDEVAELRSEFVTRDEMTEVRNLVERINRDGGATKQRVDDLELTVTKTEAAITQFNSSMQDVLTQVSKISSAASSIRTDVNHMIASAQTRQTRIDDINKQVEQNEDEIKAASRDVDDLRQRWTQAFNPVHTFIMGDGTRPPLMDVIQEMKSLMQDDMKTIKAEVQPAIDFVRVEQKRRQDISNFLTSRLGAVVVSIMTLAVLGLFGNVDLNMFGSGLVKLLFGG